VREVFYGGSCGGGKSIALLMGALQYVDIPGYNAILFRRTFSELTLPGSLMFVAHEWLYKFKASKRVHWSEHKKTYTFYPSGATLTFGYLENSNDKYRYQSSSYQYIGFDELTHFEQDDYLYLFSRLRRTKEAEKHNIPLRMRSASNPGASGHLWVKKRFIEDHKVKDRIFIPASMYDNKYLDTVGYLENLNELNPLERARLLNGDWSMSGGGQIFKREWFEILDVLPETKSRFVPRVRYWDLAATDATVSKAYGYEPAYTVGLRMARYKDLNNEDLYVIEDVQRFQKTPDDVEAKIKEVAKNDGKNVDIWMEQEPGSAGINTINYYRKTLQGYSFRGQKETGSKVLRANRVAATAGAGKIKLLKGIWNEAFLDEMEFFPEIKLKDQVDAFSGAFDKLHNYASYSVIPTAVGQESDSYWAGV
jgi:predicted phage terminase large subunit-like protein